MDRDHPPLDTLDPEFPWLPGERFELALDSRQGMVSPTVPGASVLTVTSHRAILLGRQQSRRTTSMIPLERLSGVEIVDVNRPQAKLTQGLLFLGIGLMVGLAAQVILEEVLFVLIMGGLPAIVGIYMLAAYAFPDDEDVLLLHAASYTLRMPLATADAQRDAYLVAHRLFELIGGQGETQPIETVSPDPTGAALAPPPGDTEQPGGPEQAEGGAPSEQTPDEGAGPPRPWPSASP